MNLTRDGARLCLALCRLCLALCRPMPRVMLSHGQEKPTHRVSGFGFSLNPLNGLGSGLDKN